MMVSISRLGSILARFTRSWNAPADSSNRKSAECDDRDDAVDCDNAVGFEAFDNEGGGCDDGAVGG